MQQEQRSLTITGDFFKKIIITQDALASYYNNEGVLSRPGKGILRDGMAGCLHAGHNAGRRRQGVRT